MSSERRVGYCVSAVAAMGFASAVLWAQTASFHGAPAAAAARKNPIAGQAAVAAGARTYQQSCSACHGATGQGTGNIPRLVDKRVQSASDGELFWFITKGDA